MVLNRSRLRMKKGWERIKEEVSILRTLRAEEFDTVICTFPEDRFAVWAFLSGARHRVGQKNQSLNFLLNLTPGISKSDNGVLEYYCDLARYLGATIGSIQTEFTITTDDHSWAEKVLSVGHSVFVIVHPGATGAYKIWPPSRFAEMIDSIQLNLGIKVLLCASPYDEPVVKAIKDRLRTNVAEVDIGGKLGRLAALMVRSKLCISNDSGPRHLAVAVGAKSLAVFRKHITNEWMIYAESSRISTLQGIAECPHCPTDRCLDRIPQGESFGSSCVRMVETEHVMSRIREMAIE